ncbi:hypothetical protein [Neorhizobium galegae]|uniref:hypothetical protein n=1 Tax=Neorhizobium galegae TaxID=399 RepID=UPI00127E69CA|nr:hypothetical protein [Neorhizobium galegae]KAA9387736.1 hypothetical protein F4V88_15330 [Neorhizobium galegae]MCM2498353.1 hypothetical protein [Neorhizobium galegae]MCQ1774322.1 hypothetical protein [Neorhizobium galegae]MCQ1799962.1 hypothetical protein [Neorhizobium galegae]
MKMKLVEAEVSVDRAAEIVGVPVGLIESLVAERGIRCSTGSALNFSDLCDAFATTSFRRAYSGRDVSIPDTAAAMCRMPMLAFASLVAEVRYGFTGSVVRTTHPEHVPERFVVMSGDDVCRVGTLEHYERSRSEVGPSAAAVFAFDTKVAAEKLVTDIKAAPFRWETST